MAFGIDDLAAGAAIAGGSALSGLLGNKKAKIPNYTYEVRANAQQDAARLMDAFYGDNWRSGYAAAATPTWEMTKHGNMQPFGSFRYSSTGGGGTGGTGQTGLYGGSTPFGNAPILQQLQATTSKGLNANDRTLADYNRGAEQGYREAAKYGTGQTKVAESDAAKSLKDANAMALARLTGAGLGGSTIATDALGANAASNQRELARAKANIADQATGLKLQQRNTATAGRAALQQSLNQSNTALRMAPINAQMQVLQSPIANAASQSPGGNPVPNSNGNIWNTLGDTAGQLGGLFLAKSLYDQPGVGSVSDPRRSNLPIYQSFGR